MSKLDDNEIAHLAQGFGAEFFGVADISSAHDFVLAFGGSAITEYPRAVSMGVSLSDTIVNALPRWAERAVDVTAAMLSHAFQSEVFNCPQA